MATKTRLFNIRISEDKHKRFKKFAEENEKSMGGILLNYIDDLLDGDGKIVGFEDDRKTAKIEDPAALIRGQYRKGIDF